MKPEKPIPNQPRTSPIASLLNLALTRLQKQNELASVRAIAAHIKLSPSYLNKIFRGERKFPARVLNDLAKVLRLDQHEVAEIHRLIVLDFEREELANSATHTSAYEHKIPTKIATDYKALGKTEFWLLEDWFHIPLLNLLTTTEFSDSKSRPASIDRLAQRLAVSKARVEDSLRRLVQDGYLVEDAEGRLRRSDLKLRVPTERSYEAVRNFHSAMIEKALTTLKQPTTPEEFRSRLISGVSFAGDPAKLPQAKLILEEALYRAAECLADGDCSEVFQVNLQLFKLTHN